MREDVALREPRLTVVRTRTATRRHRLLYDLADTTTTVTAEDDFSRADGTSFTAARAVGQPPQGVDPDLVVLRSHRGHRRSPTASSTWSDARTGDAGAPGEDQGASRIPGRSERSQ